MLDEKFLEDFKNIERLKEKTYIDSYIEKDKNMDPAEREKINKIKINQALKDFLTDKTVD